MSKFIDTVEYKDYFFSENYEFIFSEATMEILINGKINEVKLPAISSFYAKSIVEAKDILSKKIGIRSELLTSSLESDDEEDGNEDIASFCFEGTSNSPIFYLCYDFIVKKSTWKVYVL
jgi:hypothetical protein